MQRCIHRFALAMALGLVAACAGNSTGSDGQQLIVARVGDVISLDPAQATDGLSLNVTSEIFRNLVRFRPGSFAVQPDLATSWKVSPDGKRWTFTLKKGMKFSDGTALDASAVKFNFDRWRLPNNPYRANKVYAYYRTMFGGFPGVIVEVTAQSPTEVTLTLASPFGPFLRNLAMPSFGIGSPAAMKKDLDAYALRPVASGPYTVTEWVKDDHVTLQANPLFDGPKPAYQTVIVRDIPDQATSVLSLQKGDVDILVDPRPDDAAHLAKQTGITIFRQPSNNNSYLAMNIEKTPFADVRVRRAIAYALDIPAIVKGFYLEGAQVADNWTPPGMLGENHAVRAYAHDPAKARALLAQAGLASGFSTTLFFPTSPRPYMPEPQRVAEAIQADLRKVGINVTLLPLEFGVFLNRVRNGEHPMCLIGWTGDNGDPDNFLYTLLDRDAAHKPNAQNYAFWRNPHFHDLMIAAQRTVAESKRGEIYREANAMVHDQAPAIPIVHTTVPFAAKSSIRGIIPRPDSILNFELMKPKM